MYYEGDGGAGEEVNRLASELTEVKADLADVSRRYDVRVQELDEAKDQLREAREVGELVCKQKANLERGLKDFMNLTDRLSNENRQLNAEIAKVTQERDLAREAARASVASLNTARSQSDERNRYLSQQLIDRASDLNDALGDLDSIKEVVKQLMNEKAELQEQVAQQAKEWKQESREYQLEAGVLSSWNSELQNEIDALRTQLVFQKKEYSKVWDGLMDAYGEIDSLRKALKDSGHESEYVEDFTAYPTGYEGFIDHI